MEVVTPILKGAIKLSIPLQVVTEVENDWYDVKQEKKILHITLTRQFRIYTL